jgi:hypothetical protein
MKRPLPLIAGLLGVLFLAVAAMYWFVPAGGVPSFFPGFKAASAHIVKHATGWLIIALVLFALAWLKAGAERQALGSSLHKVSARSELFCGADETGARLHLQQQPLRQFLRARHGLSHRQVEQHHSIGPRIACNACADGTASGLAFSHLAHGLGGQRAPTGATEARGRVRSIAGTAPDAMQSKELVEEIDDFRLGALADKLIRLEPVDFVSGEAQLTISRHHVGIDLQRRMIVLREVVLPVHLQHDALTPGQEEQEVHALTRKWKAMPQCSDDSGVVVKIDLGQERRQRLAAGGPIGLEVGGEELALGV